MRSPYGIGVPWTLLIFLLIVVPSSGPAVAQEVSVDPIAAAQSRYDDADFEGALTLLGQAYEGVGLARQDLLRLLLLRALSHFGMGERAAMDGALLRLAHIHPSYELGAEVPPSLRSRFNQLRSEVQVPLAIETELAASASGARLNVGVVGDSLGLVRARLFSCVLGTRRWNGRGEHLELPASPGDRVRCEVRAVGPGGAVLLAQEELELLVPNRIAVESALERTFDGVVFRLDLAPEAESSVTRRDLRCRRNEGLWVRSEELSLALEAEEGDLLTCRATLSGAEGEVLAQLDRQSRLLGGMEGGDDGLAAWPFVTGAGVVALVAAVVAGVLLSDSGSDMSSTLVSGPTLVMGP